MPRLTPEQRIEAASMYARGMSLTRIAAHFSCHRGTVKAALNAQGISMREQGLILPAGQRAQAASLYARGLSVGQIAAHFGCSKNAVRNALKAQGVKFREKLAARLLRDQFPTKQHEGKPKKVYRPCPSVFELAAHL